MKTFKEFLLEWESRPNAGMGADHDAPGGGFVRARRKDVKPGNKLTFPKNMNRTVGAILKKGFKK